MKAIHLQTEYLTEPIGLGIAAPRFFWNCEDGITQTAYQIIAKAGSETIWNSGKVLSSQMTHIPYAGRALHNRERVYWSVKLWDENGVGGEIASSFFELGLLDDSDWKASWISGAYKPEKNARYPADYFRKEFTLKGKISRARLYATACGVYELTLNGERVGDFVLAPGCTDYRKRIQYQTYDVTRLLKGKNTLDAVLADGWYRGSLGAYGQTGVYGHQTKLLCQLEITYADGTTETVCTDESWRWSNDGPIRFSDLKDGEIYNANWIPSYSGFATAARETVAPSASDNVAVKEMEHFRGREIMTPSGKRVIDFGQNIAGFLSFRAKGQKGSTVLLRMGETLDDQGEFTQANFQKRKPIHEWGKAKEMLIIMGIGDKVLKEPMQLTPLQEVRFTCSGKEDRYKTAFAVFGFRYALLDGDPDVEITDIESIAVYSDLEQTGTFSCSHDGVNRLLSNTLWSMKGNYLDIPSDCPTRERLGWTGDAQVFFNTGAYLMNTAPFFRKWLKDMNEGRMKNGISPSVVPMGGCTAMYENSGASVGWADAMVLIPYRYWKRYGDIQILKDHYGMMADYAKFLMAHTGHRSGKDAKQNPYNKYVYEKGMHLGEWLESGEFQESGFDSQKPHPEEATAYLHYTMSCMTEIAATLGKTEDAELYREYADGSRKAYQWMFLQNGAPDTDRQAKLVRPLALGLTEGNPSLTKALRSRLAKAAENRNYQITTGFLSTAFLLPELTKAGYADIAYKMLENRDAPGWLYQVTQGATTVWENWEGGFDPDNGSRNHYSPGAVCSWLFDTVCGISPLGDRQFRIEPVPGGSLTFARASYSSLYGKVVSSWEKRGDATVFHVEVPANCTAQIVLPGRAPQTVASGKFDYEVKNV